MFLIPDQIADNKEAIVDDLGNRVTYGNLGKHCKKVEDSIYNRYMFIILADKKVDPISLYYAVMSNKHVVLLLNPESDVVFVTNFIKQYEPRYVLVPKTFKMDWLESW